MRLTAVAADAIQSNTFAAFIAFFR